MEKSTYNHPLQHVFIAFKLMLLMAVFSLLIACDGENAAQVTNQPSINTSQVPQTQPETYTILAIGDSLTEGLNVNKSNNYPALLEQALHQQGYQQVKVVNSGLSGETSSGLKNRLDWVLQINPDLTILNIGANDAMRGLPLDLTTSNINDIINRVKATESEIILAGMQIYDNLGREYVDGFKDIYPEMAAQHKLPLIPFFLEHVAGDAQLNQADMIHPTAAGYEVIVKRNIMPVVQPIIEQNLTANSKIK